MEIGNRKVCVTGACGFIASSVIQKLLNQGCTVHATLRNLVNPKVDILRSFPGADSRLKLFEADLYRAEEFEEAIRGCEFVFHVATPLLHTEGYKFQNRIDATVESARSIATVCVRSGTVRRLIYTASVTAASPIRDGGSDGYKETMDETCWTPLHLSLPQSNDFLEEYTRAKTLAEKELLSFCHDKMEVVSLACGLVGGETLMRQTSGGVVAILGVLGISDVAYETLKFIEVLLSKIPLIHIEDVTNALIFCMEQPAMSGRFLCANGFVSAFEMAAYCENKYPELVIKKELFQGHETGTKWGSSRLCDMGFEYKFDWRSVLDDSISSARKNYDVGL